MLSDRQILTFANERKTHFDQIANVSIDDSKRNAALYVHLLQLYFLSCKVIEKNHPKVYSYTLQKYREMATQLCFVDSDAERSPLTADVQNQLELVAQQRSAAYEQTLRVSVQSTYNLSAALPLPGPSATVTTTRLMLNVQLLNQRDVNATANPYHCLKQGTLTLHRYQRRTDVKESDSFTTDRTNRCRRQQWTQSIWMPCRQWLSGRYETISLSMSSAEVNNDPYVVIQLQSCTEESLDQSALRCIRWIGQKFRPFRKQRASRPDNIKQSHIPNAQPSFNLKQSSASVQTKSDAIQPNTGENVALLPPVPCVTSQNKATCRTIGWMRFRLSSLRPGVNRLHMQLLANNGQPLQIDLHVYTLLRCRWWRGGYIHFRNNWVLHGTLLERFIWLKLRARDDSAEDEPKESIVRSSETGPGSDESDQQMKEMKAKIKRQRSHTFQIQASSAAGRRAMRRFKREIRKRKAKRKKLQPSPAKIVNSDDGSSRKYPGHSPTMQLHERMLMKEKEKTQLKALKVTIDDLIARQRQDRKRKRKRLRMFRMQRWQKMHALLESKGSLIRRSWVTALAPHAVYLDNEDDLLTNRCSSTSIGHRRRLHRPSLNCDRHKRNDSIDSVLSLEPVSFIDWNGIVNKTLFEPPVTLDSQGRLQLPWKGLQSASFCICSEWCNVHSFYYYNSIGRFALAQNQRLFALPPGLVIPLHLLSLTRLMRRTNGRLRCYNLLSSLLAVLARHLSRRTTQRSTNNAQLRHLWMTQEVDILLASYAHLWHLRRSLKARPPSSTGTDEDDSLKCVAISESLFSFKTAAQTFDLPRSSNESPDIEYLSNVLKWLGEVLQVIFNLKTIHDAGIELKF